MLTDYVNSERLITLKKTTVSFLFLTQKETKNKLHFNTTFCFSSF